MTSPRSPQDYPPGMQGGVENDRDDHRIGETGQTGPEAPGDIDRSHPEWRDDPKGGDKSPTRR